MLTEQEKRFNELEEELLEIIERRDEFTQSDLQGVIASWVRQNCTMPVKALWGYNEDGSIK